MSPGAEHRDERRGPNDRPEIEDHEGADVFETTADAREARREDAPERQDEEIITLDSPD